MAIIPGVPGLSAEILVDGHPLTEYLDDEDEDEDEEADLPSMVTRYVECVSGSNFAIRWTFSRTLHPDDHVVSRIYLDGIYADSGVQDCYSRSRRPTTFTGVRFEERGSWKEKAFRFADMITTEEGEAGKPDPMLQKLGTITLTFHRVELIHRVGSSDTSRNFGEEAVHEKHLKGQAISHRVKLGDPVAIATVIPNGVRYLDAKPFATITFRYRSRRALQSLGIIPRSPTPVPLENRPRKDLTREELLELLRRQDLRGEQQIKIKKELKREREYDSDDSDLPIVSSERRTKAPKTSIDVTTGIETVDLTGD